MQADPQVIGTEANVGDVLLMRSNGSGNWLVLPIVDGSGRLHGMLHANDLMQG
jgi:arabinose-5-phosphate isomerase